MQYLAMATVLELCKLQLYNKSAAIRPKDLSSLLHGPDGSSQQDRMYPLEPGKVVQVVYVEHGGIS